MPAYHERVLQVTLGTSKFLIVPFGLSDLWMSWDDLFFGSPLIRVMPLRPYAYISVLPGVL